MSICVHVHISKIMRTPIKVGVRTNVMYANYRTLQNISTSYNKKLAHLII